MRGRAVDEHGAGAALSLAAAVLGAGELEVIAEDAEQRRFGLGVDRVADSVDNDFSRHVPLACHYRAGAWRVWKVMKSEECEGWTGRFFETVQSLDTCRSLRCCFAPAPASVSWTPAGEAEVGSAGAQPAEE